MSLKGFLSFQDTNYLRQSNASTIYDPRIIILTANHWHVAKQFFHLNFFICSGTLGWWNQTEQAPPIDDIPVKSAIAGIM